MQRYAAAVEYCGQRYCGWQRQRHSPSVQQEVENALSKVAAHDIQVQCAGRTDTGVHALNQIIHFDSPASRHEDNWLKGANQQLPDDISLRWVQAVSSDFHARFSALSRTYYYRILNRSAPSGVYRSHCTWVRNHLDNDLMQAALTMIHGEHDFTSFRGSGCQSRSAHRCVIATNVSRQNDWVTVAIEANAFLLHMVRNIVGSLLQVGMGLQAESYLYDLLQLKDRRQAAKTAPATGLYLVGVNYPSEFGLTHTCQTGMPEFDVIYE